MADCARVVPGHMRLLHAMAGDVPGLVRLPHAMAGHDHDKPLAHHLVLETDPATMGDALNDKGISACLNTMNVVSDNNKHSSLSYKDKLINSNENIAISFFSSPFYSNDSTDSESDDEEEKGVASIKLSKEEKQRIRAPWAQAIIVKTYGKNVGYKFLYPRLMAQWKREGKVDCIDLGKDFFLFQFHRNTDYAKVILPGLSIEFFDVNILKRIGNQIGHLVRIDANTASTSRGKYARLCVEVDLDTPLLHTIKIGKYRQLVLYESVSGLCFKCGCIGHSKNNCPSNSSDPSGEDLANGPKELSMEGETVDPPEAKSPPNATSSEGYRPWMVVTRRKIKPQPTKSPTDCTNTMPKNTHNGSTVAAKPNAKISRAEPAREGLSQMVIASNQQAIKNDRSDPPTQPDMLAPSPMEIQTAMFTLTPPYPKESYCGMNLGRSGSIRAFRFEWCWFNNLDFLDFVHNCWNRSDHNLSQKSSEFVSAVRVWNRETFGNVFIKNKKLLARIQGIQKALCDHHNSFFVDLEKELIKDYNVVLKDEEEFWKMKSRVDWILDGDRNTSFFHLSIIIRRKRNRDFRLKDSVGNWINQDQALASHIINHFQILFSTSLVTSDWDCILPANITNELRLDTHDSLCQKPSRSEIHKALFSMKPRKSPSPDGLHPGFFQKCWKTVAPTIWEYISKVFTDWAIPAYWSESLIALIPKSLNPESITQFRPIGLCNTSYKIVSKILVNRIRPLLFDLISPNQASFILVRKGTDNIILVQEIVHSFSKQIGKVGNLLIKLDLDKAYDKLEWSFIRQVLLFFNFPKDIISLIMSCISSASMSIFVNGSNTEPFQPTRGIRQGDPLSPYIFILCIEYLSIMINDKLEAREWTSFKTFRNGHLLTHLFFADDLILFAKTTPQNCVAIQDVLDTFTKLSAQQVNHTKSKILFSKNTEPYVANAICDNLGFDRVNDIGKYLGFPISHKAPSKANYSFIVDKINQKLAGWKTRLLSHAAKTTLINSSITATAGYYMQAAAFPVSTLNDIDRAARNFLWGSTNDSRKLHLINWIWSPTSLWVSVFRNKYLACKRERKYGSPLWRRISKASGLLKDGIKWTIKDGERALLWHDNWSGLGPLRNFFIGPLNLEDNAACVSSVINQHGTVEADALRFFLPSSIIDHLSSIPT
ncbi:reverse transcriptase [Corchorus capsularis]|uniref:Reverse transcriptase n=1 Tax=Corchorus capsularis TaxID=210143 RepID=A0A1R3G587_COCAP|nr:reverse transcriptase [Corchorus capsularis]